MAQARRHILPFFIPHLGCPQQCIFCDQHKIAGSRGAPTAAEVASAIGALPEGVCPELAFYGGSFTALSPEQQIYYLAPARRAVQNGTISGIRVSTRPDCINPGTIRLLQEYGVGCVELGVQSMCEAVLKRAKRGHGGGDSLEAVRLLKKAGFCTGVQLLPGLPGETESSAVLGARRILAEKPDLVRIYPAVVLAGTELGELYQREQYRPWSLEKAAKISLFIKLLAEEAGAQVIRMGLQPTEELGSQVLAGPYHPAFGELVLGLYNRCKVMQLLERAKMAVDLVSSGILYCPEREISAVLGQKRCNLTYYQEIWPNLRVKSEKGMQTGSLRLKAGGREWGLLDEEFRRCWRRSRLLQIADS